ncbi:hypothetical protein NDU88_004213 [Pleurodeles waltl]|uniref:Uncharacterized protein n=1 Tax=Pleurodeles waltl TaxID=8319 RepID=A0AAV7RI30_PLEWA|nr:hypothetical protein NDU88_004213 [Pleurodeles waltl]
MFCRTPRRTGKGTKLKNPDIRILGEDAGLVVAAATGHVLFGFLSAARAAPIRGVLSRVARQPATDASDWRCPRGVHKEDDGLPRFLDDEAGTTLENTDIREDGLQGGVEEDAEEPGREENAESPGDRE